MKVCAEILAEKEVDGWALEQVIKLSMLIVAGPPLDGIGVAET